MLMALSCLTLGVLLTLSTILCETSNHIVLAASSSQSHPKMGTKK
jgi:hypothetical protein